MRHLKFPVLLTMLSVFILGSLLLAGAQPLWAQYVNGPKLTLTNHSGYPDNQIYLVFWGIPWSETDLGNNFHRLDWKNNAIGGTYYADYSTTMDKLNQDALRQSLFLPAQGGE